MSKLITGIAILTSMSLGSSFDVLGRQEFGMIPCIEGGKNYFNESSITDDLDCFYYENEDPYYAKHNMLQCYSKTEDAAGEYGTIKALTMITESGNDEYDLARLSYGGIVDIGTILINSQIKDQDTGEERKFKGFVTFNEPLEQETFVLDDSSDIYQRRIFDINISRWKKDFFTTQTMDYSIAKKQKDWKYYDNSFQISDKFMLKTYGHYRGIKSDEFNVKTKSKTAINLRKNKGSHGGNLKIGR